jgi:hypothetical protein
MGKSTRRALLGFAVGAGTAAQSFYQTKAAQEAEALREQRLAAIRAEERGQDRQFQRETMAEQNKYQTGRDERLAADQTARDAAQVTALKERDRINNQAQLENTALSGRNSLAYADAAAKGGPAARVIVRTPEGGLQSIAIDDPALSKGLPKGYELVEGRAGSRFSEIPGSDAAAPEAAAPAAAGSARPAPRYGVLMDPDEEVPYTTRSTFNPVK